MKLTVGEILEVVATYYAQHKSGLTVGEIAELVPCETQEVRDLIDTVPGIECVKYASGVYEPTKQSLAKLAASGIGLYGAHRIQTPTDIRKVLLEG